MNIIIFVAFYVQQTMASTELFLDNKITNQKVKATWSTCRIIVVRLTISISEGCLFFSRLFSFLSVCLFLYFCLSFFFIFSLYLFLFCFALLCFVFLFLFFFPRLFYVVVLIGCWIHYINIVIMCAGWTSNTDLRCALGTYYARNTITIQMNILL